VGVESQGDIFGAAAVGDDSDCFADQLGGMGAKDMDAKDPAGILLGQDLDEPFGIIQTAGASIRREGEPAADIGCCGFLVLLFCPQRQPPAWYR